jgi:hypothetical protein
MVEGARRTMSRSAVAKLKAVLIIDIIIVAVAAGTYLLLQNQGAFAPRPADFTLSNLTINPVEADADEPVSILANVTNIGELEGNYTANLIVNDQPRDNQTVLLPGGETSSIEFVDTESIVGNYSVRLGDLSGTFKIKPLISNITLSRLIINPSEAWVGDEINIRVSARNLGLANEDLSVKFMVDDVLINATKISLDSGENTLVTFMFDVTTEGSHSVKINNLKSSFLVVPHGMHTLKVFSSPYVTSFTINDVRQTTSYSEVLPEGKYTIVFAKNAPNGHPFGGWSFGTYTTKTGNSLTISLDAATKITAYYSFTMNIEATSCPSLYFWNGKEYTYAQEVSNHGWLGYIKYMNADGAIVPWRNNPWDYIKLDSSQLAPRNGYFDLNLVQRSDEIFYLDTAYMVAVDHPIGTDVYSTMVEEYIDPNYMGQVYTVNKNLRTPISAFDANGQSVLSQVSQMDGVFTSGTNGLLSPSWDNITWNRVTVNFGDLSNEKQIKLVVRATVDWGPGSYYGDWLGKFYDAAYSGLLPNGTQVTPPPIMEVKDANGNWVPVQLSRQFPIPSDTIARTFIVDMTGLFLTDDYSIRISNFWDVTFDYIAIDTSPQQNVTTQIINADAVLDQAFSTTSTANGNFTKYGNVNPLIRTEDDEFVIGRQGDRVTLLFPTSDLAPVAEGMKRDYFFFVCLWFKDNSISGWGPLFEFKVTPIPFHNMSGFPYWEPESYPYEAHTIYLQDYNTRVINPSIQKASISMWLPVITVIVLVVVNLAFFSRARFFIRFRKRSR